MAGWPRAATIGVVARVLAALLLPEPSRVRLAALGGGLALRASPSRSRDRARTRRRGPACGARWPPAPGSRSARAPLDPGGRGRAGAGDDATMRFADEQRVAFAAAGPFIVEPREGAASPATSRPARRWPCTRATGSSSRPVSPSGSSRAAASPTRRTPDPRGWSPPRGARLARARGLGGDRSPGRARASGRRTSRERGAAVAGARRPAGRRAGDAGAALAVGWSLYAAWLTPEVYAGGVTGAEVYALPASVAGLGAWGDLLTWLASAGSRRAARRPPWRASAVSRARRTPGGRRVAAPPRARPRLGRRPPGVPAPRGPGPSSSRRWASRRRRSPPPRCWPAGASAPPRGASRRAPTVGLLVFLA